ncbi:MAG: MDR family MFS transporter [Candidatus Odinarchaeota archaeon]
MFAKIKEGYKEYPKAFKVLTFATFIDQIGTFLLYPFYALYVTERFGVGMIEVGYLFSIFSLGNIFGSIIGGALADKYGRRAMVLIGLIVSGIGSILMGLANNLNTFYILAAFLGLIGNFGGPARQAMVPDLLPKEKQANGFGILRVAFNLSAVIGPLLGGFMATRSYMLLFISDAISSIITAIIVFVVIPETKPQTQDETSKQSVMKTLIGYKDVVKDWKFMIFIAVSAIIVLVYMQMNGPLSVFLRDVHGFPIEDFAWLVSMNALIVVLFQFWITRIISKYTPMKMMAFGMIFLMIGFGMYGFVSKPYMFFVAMAIITVGECIVFPLGQSIAAAFAQEDKRGRYMAIYAFQWMIPNLFGVLVAGLVWEYIGPNWVWYFAGLLSLISIIGFLLLEKITTLRFFKEKEPINEEFTEMEITSIE